jgi:hypothetical protein
MNNQNINNFMSGMMNNQAFFNGGDQQDNPLFDDKKFQDSLNTGPRGGTSIQSLKTGGGGTQSFQYNPNEFSQPPQSQQSQPPQFQQQQPPFQQQPPQFQQQPPQFQQQPPQFQQQQPQFQQQPPQFQQPPFQNPMRQQPPQFHHQQQYQQKQYQQQLSQKFNDNVSQMSQLGKNSQYSECSRNSKNSRNSNKSIKEQSPIKKLGNIINNKLKDKNEPIINSMSSHDTMTIKSSVYDTEDDNEIIKKIDTKSTNETYFEIIKDAILIVVIYLILSQDFLKRAIIGYIPQIETENVVGNAIYGVIHAIIFIVFKMIFNSIFM